MNQVISTEKVPIKIWADYVEDSALEQAYNLANLPFVYKHVALMPDVHAGKGMPIGGVLATKRVVIPNAVGVDIGCGVCFLSTNIKAIEAPLAEIRNGIKKNIPVGFGRHPVMMPENVMPPGRMPDPKLYPIAAREYQNARQSIGTLGGGNHFIELQVDEEGYLCLMIHSGSRNLGLKVAEFYHETAKKLNNHWHSAIPAGSGLNFLPADSIEGVSYIREMNYCVDFALKNREMMIETIKLIITDHCPGVSFSDPINIAHNYARLESHFGEDVWVHRKGATYARYGVIGIIPGSMGSSSFIVCGKGNPESFESCSHGAGRLMSRAGAKKNLDLEAEQGKMDGILHDLDSQNKLDEAPGAYKNINNVMSNQEDLVKILKELKPIAVVKG